ncbi:MAG: hypothetical protein LBF88_11865 [Planctomycetaceae bacterium]|jgi:hypothetical protein|nr:hypothetical protein [Planctomycetaceae bacterium]
MIIFRTILCFIFLFCCSCSLSGKTGERELIEAFVNLKEVPEPFGSQLSAMKTNYDNGKIKTLFDLGNTLKKLQYESNSEFLKTLLQSDQSTPEDYAKHLNGHGWNSNVFGLIRENINWLQQNQ